MLAGGVVGRETERHRLMVALDDPSVRLVVIRGPAGAGKTALAQEAVAAIVEREGLAAIAKQAEDAGGGSLRPIGQALAQLLDQVLERLHDPEAGMASLRTALGPSAPVLAALDPAFGALDAEAKPLTAEAAGERLAFAVCRYLSWISGLGLPILLVLDDWGRARGQVARLYERLAGEDLTSVTLIATERTEEASAAGGQLLIDLAPLTAEALHAIAAQALGGDAVTASAVLAVLPPGLTPLALLQSLQALEEAGSLVQGPQGWTLDRATAAGVLGQDAAETLLRLVVGGAPDLRRLMACAAVHGDAAPRADLQAIADLASSFEAALAKLSAEGLMSADGGLVRFAHDTIRAAVLGQMAPADRARLAGLWAERLRRSFGGNLETTLRLRLDGGLASADPAVWAPMFTTGATAARTTGDTAQARAFAEAALQLEDRARMASYATAREAGLAAVQDGDLVAGQDLAATMAARAGNDEERLEAAETAVFAARLSGDPAKAFAIGREAVRRVGMNAPEKAGLPAILTALAGLRFSSDTPARERSRHSLAAYRLMNTVGAIAFERNPGVAVVMAARSATHPGLRGGAFSAGLRCMLTCLTGDWTAASRWGETAYGRVEREDEPMRAAALQLALQFGLGLTIDATRHFAEAERLQAMALSEGDLGVAAYANRDRALASMRMPITLAEHQRVLADCKANAGRFQDQATEPLIDALAQMAVNLMEGGPEPWRLAGDLFDSPKFERECGPNLEQVAQACLTFEALLANGYGAWETTLSVWKRMRGRLDSLKHHPVVGIWAFHTGLARARLGLPVKAWEYAVVDRCARFNPVSYDHRALALKAEKLLAKGRSGAAMQAYEAAVVAGARSGIGLEQAVVAVAAQQAAKQAGRADLAERFAAAEQTAWRTLGATAMLAEPEGAEAVEAAAGSGLDAAAADRASRAKTRLLAGAAHELRTPMQGIQGLLDLAAEDPASLDVEQLREAFGGLRAVVDDLTELGAVEAERVAIVEAPFSPLRLAEVELQLLGSDADRRGRPLRLETAGEVADAALGDAGRIGQIVRNLLTNALRYGEGETVLRLMAEADSLVWEVLDEGPGLTAADQTRLFQPFVRGDASGKAEGTGLGLALSRRIAQRMGGTLVGENREGGGAVFRLTLPRRAAGAGAGAGPVAFRPLKVLLAEDTALSRETMARLLERQGHTVTAVEDGQAALEAARGGGFDLLVMDVRMPRLDGPQALAALRQAGVATPAVVLSASVDEPLARRLAPLEPVRLVRKPVSGPQLAAIVAGVAGVDSLDAVLGAAAPTVRAEVEASLSERMTALAAALEGGALPEAREIAHAAAGLAGQFGFEGPAERFGEIESACAAGDLTAAREALRRP